MTLRNYISVVSRALNLLVVALILGTLFVNLDNDQQSVSVSVEILLSLIF